jgi:hypothetical protein
MNYVRVTENGQPEYPYSLWQLRKAHPNISFPAEPTPEDLAPFNVFPVTIAPQPKDYDHRLQAVEQLPPASKENGWEINWALRDTTLDEQAAWDAAHAPSPDWMNFGIELAANPLISALYDNIPNALASGLSIGLAEASKGDTRLFVGLWQRVLSVGGISPELLGEIGALAHQFNLPAAFIAELMPQLET